MLVEMGAFFLFGLAINCPSCPGCVLPLPNKVKESVAFCHTYIDRFMAGVFDSDPWLLNYIQVGSSHCQGGVSAVSTQVRITGHDLHTTDDDPGKIDV